MPKKQILAAGYIRDIQFRSREDLDIYLYQLRHRKLLHKILDEYPREDGTVIIRILQQYNTAPLIRLYEYE